MKFLLLNTAVCWFHIEKKAVSLDLMHSRDYSPAMDLNAKAAQVLQRLRKRYPQPESALHWRNPWELLVATVLAAQCTDERVNKVTPAFFAKWPDPETMAHADQGEVENLIRSTGLFRSKAANLIAAGRMIKERFNSRIPETMQELTSLPGVGRKTANIILSNAFSRQEGIAVDTHVKRVSYRLGLTGSRNPDRIEKDLVPLFPREAWGETNHLLVLFGRDICRAPNPLCDSCFLADICPRQGLPAQ